MPRDVAWTNRFRSCSVVGLPRRLSRYATAALPQVLLPAWRNSAAEIVGARRSSGRAKAASALSGPRGFGPYRFICKRLATHSKALSPRPPKNAAPVLAPAHANLLG